MADKDLVASRKFAAKLFRSVGFTYREIANKIGTSEGSAFLYCTGTKKGKRLIPKPDSPQKAYARKLKSEGMTYAQIATILGVTYQGVQQMLRISHNRPVGPQKCQDCVQIVEKFHCHHTNYATNEFVVLCASCHTRRHCNEKAKAPRIGTIPNSDGKPKICMGFAAMQFTKQQEIASLGGKAVSANRAWMAHIGRIGGSKNRIISSSSSISQTEK